MGFIKILDDNTINKIAAGEVIEKPASIVKELVENSIDAGADDITIEVTGGGISSIRIIDNGKGIDAEDLETAFMRHATSKISSDVDLETISSLGFRGEALASIAAVSKVEMISRSRSRIKNTQIGNKIVIHGGKIITQEECGCPEGTIITIQDVFFNTPARLKFLKSESREGMYITDVIEGIALSNTKVSIKYRLNNKLVLSTRGDGDLKSVLMAVYGKDITNNIISLDYMKDFISVKGYVGNSSIAKSSRNNQAMFINGRIIRNKTVTAAVEAAFKSMLTINKFPFFLVSMVISPEFVDVNVHPSKAEVKFQDEQLVFKAVYAAVKEALIPISDLAPSNYSNEHNTSDTKGFVPNVPKIEYKQESLILPDVDIVYEHSKGTLFDPTIQQKPVILSSKDEPVKATETIIDKENLVAERNQPISNVDGSLKNPIAPPVTESKTERYDDKVVKTSNEQDKDHNAAKLNLLNTKSYNSEKEHSYRPHSPSRPEESIAINHKVPTPKFEPLSVVGQLHFVYIVAEGLEEMYLIDQHAAHERIYYEKYLAAYNMSSIQSQNLLVPVVVELSLSEKQCVLENLELFEKLGYDIEDFGGNAVSIRAIPVIYGNPNTRELFHEILQSIDLKTKDVYSAIDSILYRMSCKSAVKAGDKLGYKEMVELVEQLRLCDNPFNCPHGRPTIIKMSYYDLEKKFKRIQ